MTETAALFGNSGDVIQKSKTYKERLNGNYNTFRENAVTVFKAMKSQSYVGAADLGITKVRFQSSQKGTYVENSIPNPRNITYLI